MMYKQHGLCDIQTFLSSLLMANYVCTGGANDDNGGVYG